MPALSYLTFGCEVVIFDGCLIFGVKSGLVENKSVVLFELLRKLIAWWMVVGRNLSVCFIVGFFMFSG